MYGQPEDPEYWKKHYQKNKKVNQRYAKKRYEKNKDKIKEQNNKYRQYHPDKTKEWRKKHPNYGKEYFNSLPKYKQERQLKKLKSWTKSEKGKLSAKKALTKRNRNLGFIPLNDKFENSEGHHLDKNNVIFIPKILHRSIKHRQNNLEKMKIINIKAWDYLEISSY